MGLITDVNYQQDVLSEGALPSPSADPYGAFKEGIDSGQFNTTQQQGQQPIYTSKSPWSASRYGEADTSEIPSEALVYSGAFSAPGDENAITAPQSATSAPLNKKKPSKSDIVSSNPEFSFLKGAAFEPKQGAEVYYIKLPSGKEIDTTDINVAKQAHAKGLDVESEKVDWTAPGYYDEQRFFKELDRRERTLVRTTKDTTDPVAKTHLSRLDRIAAYYEAMDMQMPASAPDLLRMAQQELGTMISRAGKNPKEVAASVKNPIIKELLENNTTPGSVPKEAAARWLIDQYGASFDAPARYRIGDITKFRLVPVPKKSGDRVAIPTPQAVSIDTDE